MQKICARFFYINIIHFTYLFFLINTYTPCHSLLAKIAFHLLCMGYKLGSKPSWILVWNVHLICLMNAYLLETSLQIQKLKAYYFFVLFHFKVMWNSSYNIKTFPPQLKDPLGLHHANHHVFQLSILNIYQCHLKSKAIMWQGACWNISHVWFQFQIMSKLKNNPRIQIMSKF
jgi:hypothetical protein